MNDFGIIVHNRQKIVKIVQNPRLGPYSAPNLSRWTRPVAPRMRPRGNYNVRPFTWSRNFFHPTTSRGAVSTLREIPKSAQVPWDIPKSHEFTLDFSFFYRQFSQHFVGRKFGPRKHNTVQNECVSDTNKYWHWKPRFGTALDICHNYKEPMQIVEKVMPSCQNMPRWHLTHEQALWFQISKIVNPIKHRIAVFWSLSHIVYNT